MSNAQLLLFEALPPTAVAPRPEPEAPRSAPYQATSQTSRGGAEAIEASRPTIRAHIAFLLKQAGPVSADGSCGGMTAYELAIEVTALRAVKTDVWTILGRIAGESPEMRDCVIKSGLKRPNAQSGKPVDVYIHKDYLGQYSDRAGAD